MATWLVTQVLVSLAVASAIYRSYKMLKTGAHDFDLLKFWLLWGLLTAFEAAGLERMVSWLPFYYMGKFCAVLVVSVPATRMATVLFSSFVVPGIQYVYDNMHQVEVPSVLQLLQAAPFFLLAVIVPGLLEDDEEEKENSIDAAAKSDNERRRRKEHEKEQEQPLRAVMSAPNLATGRGNAAKGEEVQAHAEPTAEQQQQQQQQPGRSGLPQALRSKSTGALRRGESTEDFSEDDSLWSDGETQRRSGGGNAVVQFDEDEDDMTAVEHAVRVAGQDTDEGEVSASASYSSTAVSDVVEMDERLWGDARPPAPEPGQQQGHTARTSREILDARRQTSQRLHALSHLYDIGSSMRSLALPEVPTSDEEEQAIGDGGGSDAHRSARHVAWQPERPHHRRTGRPPSPSRLRAAARPPRAPSPMEEKRHNTFQEEWDRLERRSSARLRAQSRQRTTAGSPRTPPATTTAPRGAPSSTLGQVRAAITGRSETSLRDYLFDLRSPAANTEVRRSQRRQGATSYSPGSSPSPQQQRRATASGQRRYVRSSAAQRQHKAAMAAGSPPAHNTRARSSSRTHSRSRSSSRSTAATTSKTANRGTAASGTDASTDNTPSTTTTTTTTTTAGKRNTPRLLQRRTAASRKAAPEPQKTQSRVATRSGGGQYRK